MITNRGHRNSLTIPILCCFLLTLGLRSQAQQIQANKQNSQTDDSSPENSKTLDRPLEMEKLAKMLVGNWNVTATLEPNASRPRGRKDTGTNRIVLGPGARSIVENYHTEGDSGSHTALGILWWDEKAQGYRTMFCDSADHSGCTVYDGLGRWEGNDLVFRFRFYRDGNQIAATEVLATTAPSSFVTHFFESRNGGPEEATWTVSNTKVE